MATRYLYSKTLVNEYLGKSKVVRAATLDELNLKVWEVQRAWAEQEQRKRDAEQRDEQRKRDAEQREAERQAVSQGKAAEEERKTRGRVHAEQKTLEAQAATALHRGLLEASLGAEHQLEWDSLIDTRSCPSFSYAEPRPAPPTPATAPPLRFDEIPPTLQQVRARYNVPPRREFLEKVLRPVRRRRESLESEAHRRWEDEVAGYERRKTQAVEAHRALCTQCDRKNEAALKAYKAAVAQWEARRRAAEVAYDGAKEKFCRAQDAYNDSIRQLQRDYESGEPIALTRYVEIVLGRSQYLDTINPNYQVDYEPVSSTVVVGCRLPNPGDLPRALEYRYVVSRDEMTCTEMKPKDFDTFYESVLQQMVLRAMHEVFSATNMLTAKSDGESIEACYTSHVQSVVVNGWVHGVDPKTGNDFESCIISCQASREQFEAINLARVSPKECLRNLRALDAGPLAQLAPVRPILELDRNDSRFVESREILADLGSSDNLAEMDWEDFEHLVRELFSRMFSTEGAEVKVTQASRDRGVDAIAFDPDPIRGGKFVIQAKRYNNVVPVAAVRDLYGTVINEGAAKGILVTTSHYGNDSREFAKDKPLTLIDGPNLVYLFQEHGYEVRIDLRSSPAT